MKFLRMLSHRDPMACEAVRRDHIPNAPSFVACTVHGSDIDPAQIDLYDRPPEYNTAPFCTYHRMNGNLITSHRETRPERPKGKSK